MKVGRAIEALKKLSPNDEIFITWFDQKEFEQEFEDWSDLPEALTPIANDKWVKIVEGTENDDRVAEAIIDSMRYDFNRLYEEYVKTTNEIETDTELWEQ